MGSLVKKVPKSKRGTSCCAMKKSSVLVKTHSRRPHVSLSEASEAELPSSDSDSDNEEQRAREKNGDKKSALARAVLELQRCVSEASDDELQDSLPLMLDIVRESGRRLDIDVQKKMHEYIYAHKHGLKVNTTQGGADLHDVKSNKKFEHKSMKLDVNRKMCNVNIVIPTWPPKTSKETYAKMAHHDILSKGDVRIEARNAQDSALDYEVTLSAKFVARYAKEYIEREISKKRLTKFNIGGRACPECNRVHRLDRLVKDSDNFDGLTNEKWADIVTREVPYRCDH